MVGPRMVNFSLLPDAFSTWEKMTGALAYEIEIRLADPFSPSRKSRTSSVISIENVSIENVFRKLLKISKNFEISFSTTRVVVII